MMRRNGSGGNRVITQRTSYVTLGFWFNPRSLTTDQSGVPERAGDVS
jgi:hypothetical protein